MRKETLAEGEYYHVFNRGVDKRRIFGGLKDMKRFREVMINFNSIEARGGLRVDQLPKNQFRVSDSKLVEIVGYCLLPNHFHLLLRQISENGISKFMGKVCGGYVSYFNQSNKRSGSLFQGKFKVVHVESNEQLLKVASYVNLNNKIHKIGKNGTFMSSWREYTEDGVTQVCTKDIVLDQFKDRKDFIKFSKESVDQTLARRLEDDKTQSLGP